jgi:hypothetical protein
MTSNCTRDDRCSLVHAFSLVSSTKTAIKLGVGSHSIGGTGPVGLVSVSIYGPGTIAGDGGPTDGATLRAIDLTWNGGPGCLNSAPNLPYNTLELRRVDVVAYSINVEVCNATIRDSRLRSAATAPAQFIGVSGERAGIGGATSDRGSMLKIERSVIDGGDPGVAVFRVSTIEATNTIFKNQGTTYGWISVGFDASATSTIKFSTFHNSVLTCGSVAGTGFVSFSNNIFVNNHGGAPADTATGTYCSHAYDLVSPQTTTIAGPGNKLGVDPTFANSFGGDFHLLPGSPAIDAADPAATEAFDYDGTSRPQGAARDLGAFEYH